MTELKRLPVKYIRDYIKKDYIKDTKCYICDSTQELELHHLYSLSQLFNSWCTKNKINIDNVDILVIRTQFYEDNKVALDNSNLVTLCKKHHMRLHNIYGQTYSNNLIPKIRNWLEVQKNKYGI